MENILSYKNLGFDFFSHSNTHNKDVFGTNYETGNYTNFSKVSDESIINELKTSYDFIIKYGLNSDCICWPWGHYPMDFNSILNNPDPDDPNVCGAENQRERYAKIAKNIGYRYGLDSIGGAVNSKYFEPYWITREPFYESSNNEYYFNLIDQCIQSNGWLILMTHVNDPLYASISKISAIIDYALSKSIQILPIKEAYSIKKPSINIGLTFDNYNSLNIGSDGIRYN